MNPIDPVVEQVKELIPAPLFLRICDMVFSNPNGMNLYDILYDPNSTLADLNAVEEFKDLKLNKKQFLSLKEIAENVEPAGIKKMNRAGSAYMSGPGSGGSLPAL